jgi:folate-dependent phosphoribosylglycinamide formyltransferase PurN
MKVVYLFCNFDWGLNFLKAFLYFSRFWEKKSVSFKVVFSKKGASKKTLFIQRLKVSLWKLRYQTNVKIYDFKNINKVSFNKNYSQVLGIIAGFNQIFKKETIEQFSLLVNFHPSILPLYRGPSPLLWNLKLNEDKAGFTVHKVTENIDEGEILFQDFIEIQKKDLKWIIHFLSLKALPYFLELINSWILFGRLPSIKREIDAFKMYKNKVYYVDKYGNITWWQKGRRN